MTFCNERLKSKVQYSELNGRFCPQATWNLQINRSYMELADQSKKVEENDAQYDPIAWDRLRRH
jgi:hypothetical protein